MQCIEAGRGNGAVGTGVRACCAPVCCVVAPGGRVEMRAMPDTPLPPPVEVRRLQAPAAARASEVVRQSIIHCCALDHRHDPAVLAAWLANKTADHLAAWMAAPHAMAWGAYRGSCRGAYGGAGAEADAGASANADKDAVMVGFALLMQDKLALCYVVRDALHQGTGRALIAVVEDGAKAAGVSAVLLESTRTAQAFYRRHGYEPIGAVQTWAGLQAQPMCKRL